MCWLIPYAIMILKKSIRIPGALSVSQNEVFNMINLQPKINKLITALRMHGAMVKVNTQQYFSEKQGRVCTKWILWEEHPNRDGETFYSKAELLKALAEKWREVIELEKAEREESTE